MLLLLLLLLLLLGPSPYVVVYLRQKLVIKPEDETSARVTL